ILSLFNGKSDRRNHLSSLKDAPFSLLNEWPDLASDGGIMDFGSLYDLVEMELDVGDEFLDFQTHTFGREICALQNNLQVIGMDQSGGRGPLAVRWLHFEKSCVSRKRNVNLNLRGFCIVGARSTVICIRP